MKLLKKHKFKTIIFVATIFVCILSFTYGKYVSNSIWNYYLESKGFYLSSDQLGETTFKNVNNLWNGDKVFFNVKNSLNNSVITTYDINYNVTCTVKGDLASKVKCQLNGTENDSWNGVLTSIQSCKNNTGDGVDTSNYNKANCELSGYKWENEAISNKLYFNVVATDPDYDLFDVTVNITLTSNSPYKKTISGNFLLHKSDTLSEKISANYKNYDNYDRLIITNSYVDDRCIKVKWDSDKLVINEEQGQFVSTKKDSNGYINEITLGIEGKDSKSYIFYKKIFSKTYNIDEFTIEETNGC
jgi:hypothetical protein